MYRKTIIIFIMLLSVTAFSESKLKPGFDPYEYARLLEMTERQADTTKYKLVTPYPPGYNMDFRSEVGELDNRWDLWLSSDSVAVINVRGTTVHENSWLEDFYAPMVPASGFLVLGNNKFFNYTLAADSNAAVHTGFLIGLSSIAPLVVNKINEYYKNGVKDFILMGHSQGAAITFLLTSYLHYLPYGTIPDDITIKTYCSAPPKPGNQFYAYDFEYITRGGWSYSVSNIADWVPQMPFSIQTVFDFNKNNPFIAVDSTLGANLGLIQRIFIGMIEKSTLGSLNNSRDVMIKFLGNKLYKIVKTKLSGFIEPKYYRTMDYTTCGSPIILRPTPEYYKTFVKAPGLAGLFTNHMPPAYYFLLQEEYPVK